MQGRVLVEIGVGEPGNVARTTVVCESPKLLADPAVSSLSQWKLRPHTYRGVPVKVRLRQPITFKLGDDPAPWQ
ncbi:MULTISPECIES: energy transducer TonB [unclassified Variovorax]|uniref:energy transducer TonB n=1 Tax=Variovorax sp. WDL1 TaxID=207745 RepID=UPI0009FD50B5